MKAITQPPPTTHIGPITLRSPQELKAWPNNPRKHPPRQIAQLRAAIQSFGFTAPILLNEAGVVLSGHGRLQAALELKLEEVPTRTVSGWSLAQQRAFVLSDNKIGMLSSWDEELLLEEMELLIKDDFELELTAFSTAEIDLMFEPVTAKGKPDQDALQEVDASADLVTRLGDLWVLGNHKLLCGNSLQRESFEALLADECIQMAISDVPFNVAIKDVVGKGTVKHAEFQMASGEMSPQEFTKFLQDHLELVHAFAQDGALVYTFIDHKGIRPVLDAALPYFGNHKQLIVWDKGVGGLGSHYRSQHELIFLHKKGTAPHINTFELGQHGRYRTNVWAYAGSQQYTDKAILAEHPTPKPVPLIADAIRDSSHRKGIVFDAFAGSGTIFIAAERTGRYARAIELEPRYCDTSVRRWQRVTSKSAILEATGQTWEQVRAERLLTSQKEM
ncbi:site-specific DNA-methyltransferase [Variovorax sp. VNK109]|uniref:site-specific DNA-methyltransferase n=1 Tax=Variovorax sp. VNK109 TaxID=3400919 RepID=UPI003C05D626